MGANSIALKTTVITQSAQRRCHTVLRIDFTTAMSPMIPNPPRIDSIKKGVHFCTPY